jgi:hypothetical protein
MPFDKFIPNKYLNAKEIIALEVVFDLNDINFHLVHVSSKAKKIELKNILSYSNVKDTTDYIEKIKIPTIIIFNGKGIIVKKLSETFNEANKEEIFQSKMALNIDEIYAQYWHGYSNYSYLSYARKSHINEVLNHFNNKIDIIKIAIGYLPALSIIPLFNKINYIPISTSDITLENNDFIKNDDVTETEDSILVENTILKRNYVLGFAFSLVYYLNENIYDDISIEFQNKHKNYISKRKFRFLLQTTIILALILALSNSLIYFHFFKINTKLESELLNYQEKHDKLNQLILNYNNKKEIIDKSGLFDKSRFSEISDKLAASLPENIILLELEFNPKNQSALYTDSLNIFQKGLINIKGICNNSLILNEWLLELKKNKLFSEVSLKKFTYSNETNSPNFEINVKTK